MIGFVGFVVGIGLMLLIAAIRDLFELRDPARPLTDLEIARGKRQSADLAPAYARKRRTTP